MHKVDRISAKELFESFSVGDNELVKWVWSQPRLRELLHRKFIFSECGKVRSKIRNEKLDYCQRSDSAQHASLARWKKEKDRLDSWEVRLGRIAAPANGHGENGGAR